MQSGPAATEVAPAPRKLSDFIRERRDVILEHWEVAVRRMRAAQNLTRPVLLDHIPQFLEEVCDFIEQSRAGDQTLPPEETPRIHALERLELGYGLEDVVAEYSMLRGSILDLVTDEGAQAMRSSEMSRLHQALDLAIGTSVARYTRARERTLRALDRISEAALDQADVIGFLDKLLLVVSETLDSVDSVKIFLREGQRLTVRAAVGVELERDRALTLEMGEGFAGAVAAQQIPLFIPTAATDPPVKSEVLRARGTRALYGVPLLHRGETIGVATMGSCSAYDFSEEDKLLFRTLGNRATAIIVQGQLLERERETQAKLAAQRVLNDSLLQAQSDVGEGFVIVDAGRVVEVNDAFCAISGYSRGELASLQSFAELAVPEDREGFDSRLRSGASGELLVQSYETGVIAKNGKRVEVEIALKLLSKERTLIIARDITRRKQAEKQLDHLLHQVQAERQRLEQVLQELPAGVVIADAAGNFTFLNRRCQQIFGEELSADGLNELRERRSFRADGTPFKDGERPIERALRTGVVVTGEETQLLRRDGELRTLLVSAAPIRNVEGRITGGVLALLDVTERKLVEDELRAALGFRDRIMGVLSHDLRNPLSVISTAAQLLLREGDLGERQVRTVGRIASSADRIERMIRDLLDYTRARLGGGIPIQPRPVNLFHLCEQVIESMEVVHPELQLRFAAEGNCRGEWDPDRVHQVISNLIGNAIVHGPENGPVDVTLRDEKTSVVLEVHNGGPPIPQAMLPHIFEAFRQGAVGKPGGLGLGLYIVQQLVAAHAGTVRVRSTEAEGTTFMVRWPRS